MSDRTGSKQEKREYVEKQMRLIGQKVMGLGKRLDKLATITPERQKDLDELASYLDRGVPMIESILAGWEAS